ncbi:hypothetical protein BGZ94_003476, partial [Podila epigama]
MDNRPVRGSSRMNDSMQPHPNVALSSMPPPQHQYQHQHQYHNQQPYQQHHNAPYDPYEADYPSHSYPTQSPHPIQSPASPSSAGWNSSAPAADYSADYPPHTAALAAPNTEDVKVPVNNNNGSTNDNNNSSSANNSSSSNSNNNNNISSSILDFDLGALSLDDPTQDGAATSAADDLTTLPLRFSDPNPEPQKP